MPDTAVPEAVLYDVSVPISDHLVTWPGDPAVRISRPLDLANGDPATVSHIDMGSHTGTHVDAFSHFKPDGGNLDAMNLAIYTGRTLVVEIEDPERITLGELQRNPSFLDLRKTERVLFKTNNSSRQWFHEPFNEHFCHLSPGAANFLVELKIQLVGIDYLSVDAFHAKALYDANVPVHHILMDAGVHIVEGLYLHDIAPGWYDMACLPLKLSGAEGAPARVILRPENGEGGGGGNGPRKDAQ